MKKLQRQKDEYRKLPNNSHLFQSLNRPGVYLGSGSNLGQAFNSIVVRLLQVKLLRWRKWFSQPALVANSASLLVTHGGVHLFRHHPDHFAGHSLMACPFADNPSQHVYLKLLARLLPTSTRQVSSSSLVNLFFMTMLSVTFQSKMVFEFIQISNKF